MVCVLRDRIDLIYEGIATSFRFSPFEQGKIKDRIDLIYEGIATPLDSAHLNKAKSRPNWPDLRRDCDWNFRVHGLHEHERDRIDLIYEGIATQKAYHGSQSYSKNDRIDLIYEGIATPEACRLF